MSDARHTVLCVDDESNILNALKRLLRKEPFRLLTCTSGLEGLELLAQHEVHIVISDQRMPKMSGTEFLRQVKELYPQIIRIILTGYTDVDTITQSINEGHIYKFFLKPWNDQHLTLEIRQALEQYDLVQANKRLYEMTVQQNDELKQINENLENIVADRTHSLEQQNQILQLSHAILEDLPIPIIGISAELIIVLMNRAAQECFCFERPLPLGEAASDVIPGLDDGFLAEMIRASRRTNILLSSGNKDRPCTATLYPLTGRYIGRGAILTAAIRDFGADRRCVTNR